MQRPQLRDMPGVQERLTEAIIMTPEDIDNLQAGRELDILVANTIVDTQLPYHPERQCGFTGCFRCESACPHYSTDISSAWLVVEKLREMGFLFGLCDQAQTKLHAAGFSTWTSVPISAYAST